MQMESDSIISPVLLTLTIAELQSREVVFIRRRNNKAAQNLFVKSEFTNLV